jgi:uncharacterized membrane protein YgcG
VNADQAIPDVAAVARDDLLLDILGRGGAAPVEDDVAAMLAAWRADLNSELPTFAPLRQRPPAKRLLLAAAAAVIALTAAATIGAAEARPGSPLWPIAQVVYRGHAHSVVAEGKAELTIELARDAISEKRYADAGQMLDEATALIGEVRDEMVVRRLMAEVAALRDLLRGLGVDLAVPGESTGAGAGAGSGGGPGSGGGSGQSSTGPSSSPGGLPIPLPTLPLPSLPLPLLPG